MKTEGLDLKFTADAIHRIAEISWRVNEYREYRGAKTTYCDGEATEDLSFNATDGGEDTFDIDADYVNKQLESLSGDSDLSRYIL